MKHLIALAALCASLGTAAVAAPVVTQPNIVSSQYAQPQARITKNQAKQIALQTVGGGHVVAAHLDDFRGRTVWEVTVINDPFEYEVTINANNGQVLRVRKHREDGDN